MQAEYCVNVLFVLVN